MKWINLLILPLKRYSFAMPRTPLAFPVNSCFFFHPPLPNFNWHRPWMRKGREFYFSFRFCSYFPRENNVWLQNGIPCLEEGGIIVWVSMELPWAQERTIKNRSAHALSSPSERARRKRALGRKPFLGIREAVYSKKWIYACLEKRKKGKLGHISWAFLVQQHIFDATDFSQAHKIPVCIHTPKKKTLRTSDS